MADHSLVVYVHRTDEVFSCTVMQSFLWGMGMAVAFSVVGIVFSSMEEV